MPWEREQIGDCTLYRGDCREILPTLGRVDAVIADPPYGVLAPGDDGRGERDARGGKHGLAKAAYATYHDTYANFCHCIVPALNQALDVACRGAVFSGPHLQEQRKATAIGGVFHPAGSGRHPWGFKTFLPVLFYGVDPALQHGARPNTILSTARAERTGHPTTKPLAWMTWLVALASLPGETVLDPFMGSGTTGVACVQLGRSFLGIEMEHQYFDIACQRIEHELRQLPLLPMPSRAPQQAPLFAGERRQSC